MDGKEPFTCIVLIDGNIMCGETFPLMTDLKEHIAQFHLNLKIFECAGCGETFMTVDKMIYHLTQCDLKTRDILVKKQIISNPNIIHSLEVIEDAVIKCVLNIINSSYARGWNDVESQTEHFPINLHEKNFEDFSSIGEEEESCNISTNSLLLSVCEPPLRKIKLEFPSDNQEYVNPLEMTDVNLFMETEGTSKQEFIQIKQEVENQVEVPQLIRTNEPISSVTSIPENHQTSNSSRSKLTPARERKTPFYFDLKRFGDMPVIEFLKLYSKNSKSIFSSLTRSIISSSTRSIISPSTSTITSTTECTIPNGISTGGSIGLLPIIKEENNLLSKEENLVNSNRNSFKLTRYEEETPSSSLIDHHILCDTVEEDSSTCDLTFFLNLENRGIWSVLKWCQNQGLISSGQKCLFCAANMKLEPQSNVSDSYTWVCYAGGANKHCVCKSVREGTIFEGSNLTICEILRFSYLWVYGASKELISRELKLCDSSTIAHFCSIFRNIYVKANARESLKLGGHGTIVEVSEFSCEKMNCSVNKKVSGKHIFGGVEGGSKKCFFEVVPNRGKKKILLELIKKHILPDTIVVSDCWKNYDCLSDREYVNLKVYRNIILKNPKAGAHLNIINGLWGLIKLDFQYRRHRRTSSFFEDYIQEYMWRNNYKEISNDLFVSFLAALRLAYPVNIVSADDSINDCTNIHL